MNKPSFEAIYYSDEHELHIKIHEPIGVVGEFGGYEILTKSDPNATESKWHSEVVLEETEREYDVEDLKPSGSYAVTVRGRVLPDKASAIADPLEFSLIPSGLSFRMLLLCNR